MTAGRIETPMRLTDTLLFTTFLTLKDEECAGSWPGNTMDTEASTQQGNAVDQIDFEKAGGIVTAVTQDHQSGRVLMIAYMNREAFEETLRTGHACYFSRSRNRLWRKGEESGNYQVVREIRVDCDADAVLLSVDQRGDGAACHEGYESCFFRVIDGPAQLRTADKRKVDPAKYGASYGHHGSKPAS